MQHVLVVCALVLYATFSSNPIAEIPIFARTLNMSPGDLFTFFFVLAIFIKNLVQTPNKMIIRRPPAVIRFLCAFVFLAVVFLISTLLFYLTHNELATYIWRSLFNYLLWSIALVLFYFGSDSQPTMKELRLVSWILMGSFFLGVMSNILLTLPEVDLLKLISDTLKSDEMRLAGQVGDPNQLGTLAAFFSTIAILGMLREQHLGVRLTYAVLTAGTGLILLLTQSRESMLTLFFVVLCIFILLLRSKQHGKALVILLSLFLGSTLVVINIPRIVETLSAMAVGDTGYALSARGQVWRLALEIISAHPLGIGFENLNMINDYAIEQAHNAFLQSALISGFTGFISFGWFIFCLIKLLQAQKKIFSDNWMVEAYFVFLIGYLVTALWSDHFISFYTFNAVFFGFLGLVACAR